MRGDYMTKNEITIHFPLIAWKIKTVFLERFRRVFFSRVYMDEGRLYAKKILYIS